MSHIDRYRTRCPACGAGMSVDCRKCPHCGAKMKRPRKKRIWLKRIIHLLIFAVIFLIAAACIRQNDGLRPGAAKIYSEMTDLWGRLTGNAERADLFAQEAETAPLQNETEIQGNPSVEKEFADVFAAYSVKLMQTTPGIIEELAREYGQLNAGFSASADMCAEKMKSLSAIVTEGIAEMGEIARNRIGSAGEYSEWCAKLNEIYRDESRRISEAYTDLILNGSAPALPEAKISRSAPSVPDKSETIRDILEEYEESVDRYVDFLAEYYSSDDPAGMAGEYAECMTACVEYQKRLKKESLDGLSDEDIFYFNEVISRCDGKLNAVHTGYGR